MSNLLDFTQNAIAGRYSLRAGLEAIAANDTLELGPDGRAWPVQTTDYAAVGNGATQIVAETTLRTGSAVSGTTLTKRWPVLQDPVTGNLFIFNFNTAAASYGVKIDRYSAAGAALGSIILDASTFNPLSMALHLLSNGNILFTGATSAGAIKFAIFDTSLNAVVAMTTIAETGATDKHKALALSGGGFAITYAQAATAFQRLVIYSNAGAVVTAPATVATWGASGCDVYTNMVELSNTNIALVHSNVTASALGLYHAVYTALGVQVVANASIEAGSVSAIPSVSAFGGYYAIMRYDGSANMKVRVYSNAAALQGAAFSVAINAVGAATDTFKVINDGTQFWALYATGSIAFVQLTKIPVTGTGYVTVSTAALVATTVAASLDAFYDRGFIVCVYNQSNSAQTNKWAYFTVAATSMTIVTNLTQFGSTPAAASRYVGAIPGGDFSFIAVYDADPGTSASLYFYIGKYANSAVVGVALAAAAASAVVSVLSAAAAYGSNGVKGSASKQFDHSATNIYGNKGVLMSYGSVMKGF